MTFDMAGEAVHAASYTAGAVGGRAARPIRRELADSWIIITFALL
jgi:hypothetical protein